MLPAGERNGVSVCALSRNGKESWMIQNPDRRQNLITSSLCHVHLLAASLLGYSALLQDKLKENKMSIAGFKYF